MVLWLIKVCTRGTNREVLSRHEHLPSFWLIAASQDIDVAFAAKGPLLALALLCWLPPFGTPWFKLGLSHWIFFRGWLPRPQVYPIIIPLFTVLHSYLIVSNGWFGFLPSTVCWINYQRDNFMKQKKNSKSEDPSEIPLVTWKNTNEIQGFLR